MKTLWDWITTHALKWNRLAYGAALLFIGLVIIDRLAPVGIDVPSEAFWLALGVVLHAFASALNAQEAGKSEVLTLAEAIMEERKRRP